MSVSPALFKFVHQPLEPIPSIVLEVSLDALVAQMFGAHYQTLVLLCDRSQADYQAKKRLVRDVLDGQTIMWRTFKGASKPSIHSNSSLSRSEEQGTKYL